MEKPIILTQNRMTEARLKLFMDIKQIHTLISQGL